MKPGDCIDSGANLANVSGVRFPISVNTNSLNQNEKQFVCTSALLEDKLVAISSASQQRFASVYVGMNDGAFRIYPSNTANKLDNGSCTDYDPRFRPWYVSGTSSAKNIILIIDTSGSMSGSRLTIAKSAAKAVVGTFSNSDFVGVLEFDSSSNTLVSSQITRAT